MPERAQGDEREQRHSRLWPGRTADLKGFNRSWWVIFWVIVIALAVFPLPWWW